MSLGDRTAVVAEARSWLGTPWRHAARVKGAGVDCGQFIAAVFEACGWPHVEPREYPQDFALHSKAERFLAEVEQYAARREENAPLPGDVVLFRYGRCISHGGIVVSWPQIIHAYRRPDAVVLDDVLSNSDLTPRYAGAWNPWAKER